MNPSTRISLRLAAANPRLGMPVGKPNHSVSSRVDENDHVMVNSCCKRKTGPHDLRCLPSNERVQGVIIARQLHAALLFLPEQVPYRDDSDKASTPRPRAGALFFPRCNDRAMRHFGHVGRPEK